MMTIEEILKKWLEYAKFDENQKIFNIPSANYYLHRCTKQMQTIMQFDPTGALAVLFAKHQFLALCKDSRVSLYELFASPATVQEDKEMWDILTGEDVNTIESALLNNVDALVRQVVPTKMLGERNLDEERNSLLDSIESVVKELGKCHEDVFLKGAGPIQKVSYFSTYIHIYETMAACLVSMETPAVADGLYLCFIRCGNTSDCYFSFMLKSNGNLVSINERVNESFPGQHKRSRNGRWSESKSYNLFPYNFIVESSNFDYLGYSHTQVIDEEKLAFFNLTARAYMPLILAMVCLATKYTGVDLSDKPLKYVDSLLKWNLELPSPACEALTVQSDSAIARCHNEYSRCITSEIVLSAALHSKFSWKNVALEDEKNGAPSADFTSEGEGSIFVDLYGKGFELDTAKLLVTDPHLRLPGITPGSNEKAMPNNEFISTANGLDLIAYQQGRTQLAGYLRKRIFEEYLAFGGKEAIEKWFLTAIEAHKGHLIDLCVEKYVAVKTKGDSNTFTTSMRNGSTAFPYLDFGEGKNTTNHFSGTAHPFNQYIQGQYGRDQREKPLCPNTGAICSIEFVFRPNNWEEMQKLLGDLPKPLIGWNARGHRCTGNSILGVTDPVGDVGTVFEPWEQERHPFCTKWWEEEKGKYPKPQTRFNFAIAFSKRGWLQELKARGIASEVMKLPMPKE